MMDIMEASATLITSSDIMRPQWDAGTDFFAVIDMHWLRPTIHRYNYSQKIIFRNN